MLPNINRMCKIERKTKIARVPVANKELKRYVSERPYSAYGRII